jgi:Rha family phage regulatory protein
MVILLLKENGVISRGGRKMDLTIINQNGKLLADSKEVAEMIGKQHKNLLRDIQGYIKVIEDGSNLSSQDFFIESTYKNSQNKIQPCYKLTKQGCEMVANKMTGEKGILFTAEYVQAFNKMEKFSQNNFSLGEFKGQVLTLVNDLFEEKMKDVKEYYKIKSKSKADISAYIKKRLGILRADDEYEQVKARVFLLLGITKWEDLDLDSYNKILPIIDESIRVVKAERPYEQISFY